MGYTNYWHQKSDFTDEQWSKVKMEADYVRSWSELPQIKKVCEVEIHKDEIIIYGPCESMHINRYAKTKPDYVGQDLSFNFCKTRELPYDIYVWHMLTFCSMLKHNFVATRDEWSYDGDVLGIGDGVDEAVNG